MATRGFGRWTLIVGTWGVLVLPAGCEAPARTSRTGEASVRPGINEEYRTTDLDTWVQRFESESREIYRERGRIVAGLGLSPGDEVADIGAGTGLFTPLLARAVGPSGRVDAVDIVPAFLEHIAARAKQAGLENVRTVLCREDSVDLAANSIDLAFLCDTYHHFEYPRSSLRSIHTALRPGGRLVVIDFRREPGGSRQWIIDHVRAGREEVIEEIREAGFEPVPDGLDDSFLKENYILMFRKAE